MKTFIIYLLGFVVFFSSCNELIKNENATVKVEEGTKVDATYMPSKQESFLGNYVGVFEPDFGKDENISDSIRSMKTEYVGEQFEWMRENKISIFIEEVKDGKVKGHSVVAGNERPFEGEFCRGENDIHFTVKEPGDDKHDGTFTFNIKDTLLKGKWKAFARIDIQNRKYELVKKEFSYNANVMIDTSKYGGIESKFVDWTKPSVSEAEVKKIKSKMSKEDREMYQEFQENEDFASATENIYKLNSSTTLLNEKVIANMKRGDLYILRNTIYARHGYSFKYRPLRVFFDKQSWYVPFSANIKAEFSDIEKQNIQLLLKYEKNAKEFYDNFGRG